MLSSMILHLFELPFKSYFSFLSFIVSSAIDYIFLERLCYISLPKSINLSSVYLSLLLFLAIIKLIKKNSKFWSVFKLINTLNFIYEFTLIILRPNDLRTIHENLTNGLGKTNICIGSILQTMPRYINIAKRL